MSSSNPENSNLSELARRHLWMHFSRMGSYETHEVPVMVRGEGAYVWDQHGKRYLDGLAGLFTSQLGHGRTELAEAGAKQASTLAYFPLWTYAHPRAIELAERLAGYAPGDLNRIFFTSGGSEAVESAWKLVRQYFRMTGQPQRTKVISRDIAYHGTTMGALSITGIPDLKTPFEPLVRGAIKVPNTNFYRAPIFADDEVAFGQWAADEIERAILREGATRSRPCTSSRCRTPAAASPASGYFDRVRQICDRHGVLLVSDEVICAFGRLGHWFGADRYGYQPDIITVAKGLTSGYAPLGAMIASDRLMEPFLNDGASFLHGFTFAGHPVSCAVALANLDVFEGEQILQHVQSTEAAFRAALEGALRPPDRGQCPRRRILLRHRAGQGQADPALLRRRGVRAAPAGLPLRGALRSRTHLPGRRPGRPGRAALAAAHLRPGGDRLHRVDPARGARPRRGAGCRGPRGSARRRYRHLSLWWDAIPARSPRPSLPGNLAVDVCIVGAGFTGLWTAHALATRRPVPAHRRGGEGGGRLRRLGAQRRLVFRAVRHVRRRAGPALRPRRHAGHAPGHAGHGRRRRCDGAGRRDRLPLRQGRDASTPPAPTRSAPGPWPRSPRPASFGFGEDDLRWLERADAESMIGMEGMLGPPSPRTAPPSNRPSSPAAWPTRSNGAASTSTNTPR